MQKQIEKPIVQKKTQIQYFPKYYDLEDHFHIHNFKKKKNKLERVQVPKEERVVGNLMIAHLDPQDPRRGSETGSKEQTGLMKWLGRREKYSSLIKGHLLNHDLGGLGISENLFPLTSAANSTHKEAVELPTKGLLNQAKKNNENYTKLDAAGQLKNAQLPADLKLYPNNAIVYTVQVHNNYSFATGIPDEFVCNVKVGFDLEQDNCKSFKTVVEQERTIKSDLLEKTKNSPGNDENFISVSSIKSDDYMNGGSANNAADAWAKDGREWSRSRIDIPSSVQGQPPVSLEEGDKRRFSLPTYSLVRSMPAKPTAVDKDMGEVTMVADTAEKIYEEIIYNAKNADYLKAITLLMDAPEASLVDANLTKNNLKMYLSSQLPEIDPSHFEYSLLNFYIRPVEIAQSILINLLMIHWSKISRRNGLFVALLNDRWDELGGDVNVIRLIGIADDNLYRTLPLETDTDAAQIPATWISYCQCIKDILVQIKPSCDYYNTEVRMTKVNRKDFPSYITKVDTSSMHQLDEKGVEALMYMGYDKFDWMKIANDFKEAKNFLSAYYICRVLLINNQLTDNKILLQLFQAIINDQVPPPSLFEYCFELNSALICTAFRNICVDINLQKVVTEKFTAIQILKFSGMPLIHFLLALPLHCIELVRKCITKLFYMIDLEGYSLLIQKGFWTIKDMEDISPDYVVQRPFYQHIESIRNPQGVVPDELASVIYQYYDTIKDHVTEEIMEQPPEEGVNLDQYLINIGNRILTKSRPEFGDEYNEELLMGIVTGILFINRETKEFEIRIWESIIANQTDQLLLNSNVDTINCNPFLSTDRKKVIYQKMFEQLVTDPTLFDQYFYQIYDIINETLKYNIPLPIAVVYELLFSMDLRYDIHLVRCLSLSSFLCDTPYVAFLIQHQEMIANKLIPFILRKGVLKGNVDFLESFIHTLCDYEILSREFYFTCFPHTPA
jgi:hypothetical protein